MKIPPELIEALPPETRARLNEFKERPVDIRRSIHEWKTLITALGELERMSQLIIELSADAATSAKDKEMVDKISLNHIENMNWLRPFIKQLEQDLKARIVQTVPIEEVFKVVKEARSASKDS